MTKSNKLISVVQLILNLIKSENRQVQTKIHTDQINLLSE